MALRVEVVIASRASGLGRGAHLQGGPQGHTCNGTARTAICILHLAPRHRSSYEAGAARTTSPIYHKIDRVSRTPTPRLPRLSRNGNVKLSDTKSPEERSIESVKRTASASLHSHSSLFSRDGQAIRKSVRYQHLLEPSKSRFNANGHHGHGACVTLHLTCQDRYLAMPSTVMGFVLWL
jgi:hypothetical protein